MSFKSLKKYDGHGAYKYDLDIVFGDPAVQEHRYKKVVGARNGNLLESGV
jgi:hypothetical protein